MKMMNWLKAVGLRKLITVFFATIAFFVVPAIKASPAHAALPVIQAEPEKVDLAAIKRIQQKAEDLGDGAERDIGDTGLKNLKKLGENIPETIELKARQTGITFNRNQPNKKAAMDKAQREVERGGK